MFLLLHLSNTALSDRASYFEQKRKPVWDVGDTMTKEFKNAKASQTKKKAPVVVGRRTEPGTKKSQHNEHGT